MSHSMEGLDRDEFADSTAIMSHHMTYQTLRQRGLLGRQHIIVEIGKFQHSTRVCSCDIYIYA